MLFVTVALLCLISCQKESEFIFDDVTIETRNSNQVYLCHKVGNENFNLIQVGQNSVPGHLAHGDGYPEECYDSGLYLDGNCNLIDVSLEEEICGNGLDDNCDGLTDAEDSTACGCPCFTSEEVLEAELTSYYDYRINDCAGPFVGFEQLNSCNIGVSVEQLVAVSPDCDVCFDLTVAEATACQNIIMSLQRQLNLPDFCDENLLTSEERRDFLEYKKVK